MQILVLLILCITEIPCFGQEYAFPDDFKFGVATAAYQVEGAWNANGKGENIWDTLTHTNIDAIADRSTGDIACDTYSKTKEDVQLLKKLGVDFYRFSIAWSRVLPTGKTNYINPDGIRYYNELIDELLANDIKPMVTMHHFDLPQALEIEGGFQNLAIADYFEDYADVLFKNFGDRVKDWITFNEPTPVCQYGYGGIFLAPMLNRIESGYLCGRTLLIAHARAYHLYNKKYRATQGGRIGIANVVFWFEPLTNSKEDIEAAEAALQFFYGWFAHPIYTEDGDYPKIMKDRIAEASKKAGFTKSKLPELTPQEIDLIRGTADFMGLNHYTTYFCARIGDEHVDNPQMLFHYPDIDVTCVAHETAEQAASTWLRVIPYGIRKSMKWVKENYNNPEVIVTENGMSNTADIVLNDCRRINYYNSYLTEVLKAIHEDGCNVTGYTAWSFMDNFEWRSGYSERFGLYAVDFNDPNRRRIPKMSSHVFRKIIEDRKINWKYTPEGFDECYWVNSKDEL